MAANELMLFALVGAHYFFDYAGQGDFMAKAKNPAAPIPGVPWNTVMLAHCAIHGSAVATITGVWWLFFAEFFAHYVTDVAKCYGKISFRQDQGAHLLCKLFWYWTAAAVAT
jgi:hypothetical protein